MERIEALTGHLVQPNETLGELANQTIDDQSSGSKNRLFKYRYERIPIKIWYEEIEDFKERYGGALSLVVLEGELLKPQVAHNSATVVIFMHPMGIQNLLPLPMALARCGLHVVTCTSRYPNNDSCLIMEKVVLDLGACIRHCKEKLGYKKVVLAGWSGGGSLSAFYQSQAEHPTVESTPAGDLPNLKKANLIPADAILQLAAHIGRSRTLTEWLDPSILDEQDPTKKDYELDLYDPRNPNQPPYTQEYIKRFREAQFARNRRITKWVKEKLAHLKAKNDGEMEHCFVTYGTMADPRWLDLNIDPNGRKGPNWCFLGIPKTVNNGPVGLARFSTLRSWLSQWSIDDSNADGPTHLARISVPVLVIGNSDDDGVPICHTRELFNAIKHSNKELHIIQGANHYYAGQREKQVEACELLINWLIKQGMLESHLKPEPLQKN